MKANSRRTRLFLIPAVLACLFAGYAVQSASAQCYGPHCYRPYYQPPPCSTPAWYPPVYGPPTYFPPGYNPWYYNPQAMPPASMRGQAVAPSGNATIPPGGNQAPAPTGYPPLTPGGFQAAEPQGLGAAGSNGSQIPGSTSPPTTPPANLQGMVAPAVPFPSPGPAQTATPKQRICPVTGQALGSMGEPYKIRVRGRDVLLCCRGCEAKFMSDPEKYLAKLNR